MKYVAYYCVDNEFETFNTFEEAKKWLEERYDDIDSEGFSEETVDGRDFIAKITHVSEFKVTASREKDGYKWSEEGQGYFLDGNLDNEEWPYEYDEVGSVELVEVANDNRKCDKVL